MIFVKESLQKSIRNPLCILVELLMHPFEILSESHGPSGISSGILRVGLNLFAECLRNLFKIPQESLGITLESLRKPQAYLGHPFEILQESLSVFFMNLLNQESRGNYFSLFRNPYPLENLPFNEFLKSPSGLKRNILLEMVGSFDPLDLFNILIFGNVYIFHVWS